MHALKSFTKHVDWPLLCAVLLVCAAGLVTMNSFVGTSRFFEHQAIWIAISLVVFFVASAMDWSFLENTQIVVALFLVTLGMLLGLFALGHVSRGAASWFSFGTFSFQPADAAKLVVILILAKYFSRRHVEIADMRHVVVSGVYVLLIFVLVFLQPALGAAIIIFLLWLGMILVSGIPKRQLFALLGIIALAFAGLWFFGLKQYQKERIINFIHPLADIQGAGYHAYQSMIAIGSGEILGKGIGYGTQSKLQFLPEYQTDFIFAAFAEEWGFVGVVLLFILYGIILYRMLAIAFRGGGNFEILFGTGLALLFFIQAAVNIGMNIGLLPVTGNTLPFMSYGGSHLITEFLGLGILMGMRKSSRPIHKDIASNEIVGI